MSAIIKKINFFVSKQFIFYLSFFYCLFKNFSINTRQFKFLTYILILYGIFVVFFRLFFDLKVYMNKRYIPIYLILFSTIITMLINNRFFDFLNIKFFLILFFNLLVLLPETEDKICFKNIYIFAQFATICLFLYSCVSWGKFFIFEKNGSRPTGLYGVVLQFSQTVFCGMGISILAFFLNINFKYRILNFMIFLFQFATLMIEQQRSMLYGFVLSLVLIFCLILHFDIKLNKKKMIFFLIPLFIIFVLFFFLFLFRLIDFHILINKVFDWENNGRLQIWYVGFKTFFENGKIVFGPSHSALPQLWNSFIDNDGYLEIGIEKDSYFYLLIKAVAVHSVILEQLFTNGFFGLVVLLLFYFFVFVSVYKCWKKYCYNWNNDSVKGILISSTIFIITAIFSSLFDRSILFDVAYFLNLFFLYFAGLLLKNC